MLACWGAWCKVYRLKQQKASGAERDETHDQRKTAVATGAAAAGRSWDDVSQVLGKGKPNRSK